MNDGIPIDREGNLSRKQVWLAAWLSVATATDCKKTDIAARWADQCLADFDKRFPPGEPVFIPPRMPGVAEP